MDCKGLESISLLEVMSSYLGCQYLSDLRFLNGRQSRFLAKKLEKLCPETAELRQWNDALEYMTNGVCHGDTPSEAKTKLLEFLGQIV